MRLFPRAAGLILSLALAFAIALVGAPAMAAPTFPALTGRVVDQAHVLSPEVQAQLDQSLGALEAKTSRQLIVVTLASLGGYDIADYGYQLGRAWGVGQKGLNNGVLLIVAPSEHKVRIEVGYGLEPIITDALSTEILQERVIPKFKAGDVQGGIVDGAQALIDQLSLDTSAAEAKAAQARQTRSASAQIGSNPLAVVFVGLILFWVVGSVLGGGGRGGMGWIFPLLFLGGLGGGGGRYRDDDFGGGGGGGGGFSGGGGGSFGGGGSSGSW